jgi:hypothetical protein
VTRLLDRTPRLDAAATDAAAADILATLSAAG